MNEKTINLIGKEAYTKIQNTKILLVGVGGVGGFVFEALIRTGFQDITIIDGDIIEPSNINRQLVATIPNIGNSKVKVAEQKALEINKNAKIKAIQMFLGENNINVLDNDYDFIIDACDTLKTKLELIRFAQNNNITIISSMGVGNRTDASKIKISNLDKTYNDPLAKRLRKLVKDQKLNIKIPVVWSEELPHKNREVNSVITSPGVAGLLIANYIINKIISP